MGNSSSNFKDINKIHPYKSTQKAVDANGNAIINNPQNCYNFTHLIKIHNKSKDDNVIIVNDNKITEYMPVLTLSTNTDQGRDLTRDSLAVLKFIEENDISNYCVESESPDEKFIQKYRSSTKPINEIIKELSKESYKLNNSLKVSTDRHLLLKNSIYSNFNNIKKNVLNVEIYEYILKDYPKSLNPPPVIYTESIRSSSNNECAFINYNNSNNRIFKDTEKIRSCDLIKGDLNSNKTVLIPSNDPLFNFKININGNIINSEDLIKFGNEFGAKEQIRRQVINTISYNMNTISLLYNINFIDYIFTELKKILIKDWSQTNITDINEDDDLSLIKIIRPTIDEKFIIFGDFHSSYQTFIRHLLRFREVNILDENCKILPNYHIIFLGDIVDRGVYGYEICMIIYMLIILNPKNIHFNRGNHEELETNTGYGLNEQLKIQFPGIIDNTGKNIIHHNINRRMRLQSSAILIRNPNNGKYIYLSHGGIPTNYIAPFKVSDKFIYFDSKFNIIINNSELGTNNTIRWNDLAREIYTSEESKKTYPSTGRGLIVGNNLLKEAQNRGIELFIRGHNDLDYNTKLLPL